MSARPREWWTRPRVVLPIVGALVVLVALLTPQATVGRVGDARLTSYNSSTLGARLLFRLAGRLGFRAIARDESPLPDPRAPRGTTIHAVLAPVVPLSPAEAHAYLDAVRAGDALLLVIDRRDALSDSLGASHTPDGGVLTTPPHGSVGCGRGIDLTPSLWPDGLVHLYALRWPRGEPPEHRGFATVVRNVRGQETQGDAAVGFPLGHGRIVVVSDPDLLRNDVLRRCHWAADVIAVTMLEWLRAGGPAPRTTLAFDEFHQGFGPQPSVRRVVWRFLVGHPVGRALLALAVAGLLLIAAAAPRPIAPVESETVERRDPLEQVDALAHAYEQVAATRTMTVRLVRGVRSRVEGIGSLTRSRSDDAFLADVQARAPELAGDVALVRRALHETLPRRELVDIGAALRRIEQSFTTIHA